MSKSTSPILIAGLIILAFARLGFEINQTRRIYQAAQTSWIIPQQASSKIESGDEKAAEGDWTAAIKEYTEAIRIEPSNSDHFTHRGNAYSAKGEFKKALSDYEEAIRLDPDEADGYNSRAWVLATCPDSTVRNGKEAIEPAHKACELSDWDDARYIDTLAAAYAEAGDFEQAIKYQKQAIDKPGEMTDEEVTGMKDRLKLYEEGKPFHSSPPQPQG